jgi:F-type H+-transporting ATPase subunit b
MINKYTYIFQIVNFIVLYLLLRRFLFTPITRFMEDRARKIQEEKERAEAERKNAGKIRKEYEEKIKSIDRQAEIRFKEAVREGEKQGREIISAAKARARSIINDGYRELEREREKALREMKHQVVSLSVAAASRIIERELDEKKHRALVDDFISKAGNPK